MFHRSVSLSETGRRANGTRHVLLRLRDRILQWMAERKMRGEGGGEGATGAMGAASGHPFGTEFDESTPVVQQVDDIRRGHVSALDDDGSRAQCDDSARRFAT